VIREALTADGIALEIDDVLDELRRPALPDTGIST
jgi:hypothetical protein